MSENATEYQGFFSLLNEINKRQYQFQITCIPIDLIYFNDRALQRSTVTEALLVHGGMDAPLLAWPQPVFIIIMCAVGGWEGSCLEVPLKQMFRIGAFSTDSRIVVIRILSPSVKTWG